MAEANVRLRVDGRDAVNQLNRVNKAAGTLQGTVGKLVGAFAGIQAAKFVFFKTAELETQTRSLKVLTGSLNDAQKIIKELQQFGAVTPFTSSELIETAKRLKAFGFETEKIVDVTKRLGDIAGATGADLGGIATAFGQIQAKGRLQGEELLQLQERGVDLQGTLRKEYDLTAEEFQKALSKGQIGADAVTFALEKLTEKGGKYADGAIAQSDTLNGKFSTLTDNIDNVARTIGEVLTPALKDAFDLAIRTTNAINEALAARSITTKEKQAFQQEAVREVQAAGGGFGVGNVVVRHLGKTYQGPPDQVIRQITNDLINKEVQKRAGSKALAASTANAVPQLTKRPDLGGPTGGGTEQIKEQAEATGQLNLDAISYLETLEETEKIQFEAGRQIAEQLNLHDRLTKEAERRAKAEQVAAEAADPANKMREDLEQLLKLENQVAAGATAIGNAFSNAFTSVINGTKSADQAIADMLSSVAEHFMNMAAQIIAKQLAMIAYGLIMKALGVGLGAPDAGDAMDGGSPLPQIANPGEMPFGSLPGEFAEGGYVSGPTRALVGEGGEPEYIIPESKMRESMARYSRGARGGSVIPEAGGSGTSGEGGGTAVAAPIDVRYTVERINNVDYVTAEEFQAGMRQAANQGAKQGEQQTLKRLQMSSGTRKRLGM